MARYGLKSKQQLATCHIKLQNIFNEVIERINEKVAKNPDSVLKDLSIIWGYRGPTVQNRLVYEEKSTKRWPDSKHNTRPSRAVDPVPYPQGWSSEEAFVELWKIVMKVAKEQKVKLRWGGDWSGKWKGQGKRPQLKESYEGLDDPGHYELMEGEE